MKTVLLELVFCSESSVFLEVELDIILKKKKKSKVDLLELIL